MGDQVFYAEANDIMSAASKQARDNFKYFWRELYWEGRRIIPATDLAFIKAEFREGDIVEHMWVGDIEFDGEKIIGQVINDPNQLKNVCESDIVEIDLKSERFTDWMMMLMGDVCGAYSIHAMRKQMSEEERKAHDEAWGLPFGDPEQPKLPVFTEDPDEEHPMSESMSEMFENFFTENPEEVTDVGPDGFTALHHEALAGNATLCEILLRHGADRDAKTLNGETARDLAEKMGWERVVATLDP